MLERERERERERGENGLGNNRGNNAKNKFIILNLFLRLKQFSICVLHGLEICRLNLWLKNVDLRDF